MGSEQGNGVPVHGEPGAVIMERLRLTDCTLEKEIKRKGWAAAVMKYREKGG